MGNSYRQMLRSSSIIGGASVLNIVLGLLRLKVAAVLLGPTGVGLIGLLTSLVSTAAGVAGLGFGSAGTRQIAEATASGNQVRVSSSRRALFWGTLVLATIGGTVFWALRSVLADKVLQDVAATSDIGWLALAVALIVAAASQGALLNGMRQIGDLARISIGSALVSTIVGSYALWMWGGPGIVAFVLAGPLATFLLGHWFVSRLPRPDGRPDLRVMVREWNALVRLGFAFMVAGLAGAVGQFVVRILVQRELGMEALGHFQAAWAISMTYVGFVLGAMGTDYYPRLVAIVGDSAAVNLLVNEQMEVALLLSAPILLVMLGLAPWVIQALYTSLFNEAVEILRWQVLGDVLKIAAWPLGYILVASGAGKAFMAVEWLAMGAFVGLTLVLLPVVGLLATGVSVFVMYALLFAVVLGLARRRTEFRFSANSLYLLVGVAASCGIIMLVARYSNFGAAIAGVAGAAVFSVYALVRLVHASSTRGRLGRVADWLHGALRRIGVWREE